MKPFFSIVIPTYNHGRFIKKCLDSVIAQTYSNWEAIVINNFSNDNTIQLVTQLDDDRIRLINLKNNGIIAVSRNAGILEAKGEWICFLDSDDWWTPNKLEVCYENISTNVDIIYHDLKRRGDKIGFFEIKRIKGRKLHRPILVDLLVKNNCISNSSVVVRKNILERINGICEDPKMVASEDYNTWLRIAQITDNFVYIPRLLGFYLSHGVGVSHRDMSEKLRYAGLEYIELLNRSQMKKYEAIISYTSGRFNFSNKCFESSKSKLLFTLRYGTIKYQLKSLFMLISILFK